MVIEKAVFRNALPDFGYSLVPLLGRHTATLAIATGSIGTLLWTFPRTRFSMTPRSPQSRRRDLQARQSLCVCPAWEIRSCANVAKRS
jgi:hypothetical protein